MWSNPSGPVLKGGSVASCNNCCPDHGLVLVHALADLLELISSAAATVPCRAALAPGYELSTCGVRASYARAS